MTFIAFVRKGQGKKQILAQLWLSIQSLAVLSACKHTHLSQTHSILCYYFYYYCFFFFYSFIFHVCLLFPLILMIFRVLSLSLSRWLFFLWFGEYILHLASSTIKLSTNQMHSSLTKCRMKDRKKWRERRIYEKKSVHIFQIKKKERKVQQNCNRVIETASHMQTPKTRLDTELDFCEK